MEGVSFSLNDENQFSEVSFLCEKAVQDGVFPGCIVSVSQGGKELYKSAFGFKSVIRDKDDTPQPVELSTIFDISSLTNVFVTTTIIMRLIQNNRLSLDDKISRFIQGFAVNGKSGVTIRQLLNHSSGLASSVPFYEELVKLNEGERRGILTSSGARDYIFNSINRSQLKFEPGTKQVYSDVGFLLLGFLIEIVTGMRLARAAQQYVFQPLGLKSTSFIDLAMVRRGGIHPVKDIIAPTENCEWRGHLLCGEVFDDNAWAMGGVAGNSGVFCNQSDLHTFACQILKAYNGQGDFIRPDVLQEFLKRPDNLPNDGWACGWERPNKDNLLSDSKLSENAIGFDGVTGCSLWLEPLRGIDIILMSNRVHPSRANKKIRNFRPVLIDAILSALEKL